LVIEITLSLKLKAEKCLGALPLLKPLVISPNEKTVDFGCLLGIARAEACRREQIKVNPTVRALVFVAKFGEYAAICEVLVNGKLVNGNFAIEKIVDQKVECEKVNREVFKS
jgi:hypothetical protein